MSGFTKVAAYMAAFLRKHWGIITGAGMYHAFSWVFDNPIWIAVEFKWQWKGVVAMMVIAFIINTVLFIYFSNKRTDFILWNFLDVFSEKESKYNKAYSEFVQKKSLWRRACFFVTYIPVRMALLLLWCKKKYPQWADIAAFLILPIIEDPFITTMYLRHGYVNGIRMRDVGIYAASSIVSIGYWAARNAVIVELVFRPASHLF